MDFAEFLNAALPFVYIIVGAALVWFVIELAITIRKTRTTVDEMHKQLEPTLDNVQRLTASLEPVVAKVDPLVDRVSLTVDAANLELMRVDQILEGVTDITDSVSSAVDAVDTVTNAPMNLLTSVTTKVRSAFKTKHASEESIALGEKKATESTEPQNIPSSVAETAVAAGQVVKGAAVTAARATKEAVVEEREQHAEQRAQREEKNAARQAATDTANKAAKDMLDAVAAVADADSKAQTPSETETASKGYFTYQEGKDAASSAAVSAATVAGVTEEEVAGAQVTKTPKANA